MAKVITMTIATPSELTAFLSKLASNRGRVFVYQGWSGCPYGSQITSVNGDSLPAWMLDGLEILSTQLACLLAVDNRVTVGVEPAVWWAPEEGRVWAYTSRDTWHYLSHQAYVHPLSSEVWVDVGSGTVALLHRRCRGLKEWSAPESPDYLVQPPPPSEPHPLDQYIQVHGH